MVQQCALCGLMERGREIFFHVFPGENRDERFADIAIIMKKRCVCNFIIIASIVGALCYCVYAVRTYRAAIILS